MLKSVYNSRPNECSQSNANSLILIWEPVWRGEKRILPYLR